MKKILLGGIAGGFVLFIWSFLAWVVLPVHTPTMHSVQNEDQLASMLKSSLPSKGVYLLHNAPGMNSTKEAQDAYAAKVRMGPNAMIIYDPAGMEPLMTSQFFVGILIDILSALVVCWLLTRSTAYSTSYLSRVTFCGVFAIFATVFDYLTMWNWMGYPADFTVGLIVDALFAWILAGLVISAIVKAPPAKAA